jgi:Holliday junction resolvasome RuvABC endonuclease subunit
MEVGVPETHYTKPLVPLVLGLDPGLMRLGFSFTEYLGGAPRWCGTVPIYEKDRGWRYAQLQNALMRLRGTLLAKPEAHYTVVAVSVEQMFVGINSKTAIELADVAGMAVAYAHQLWPDAQIDRFSPAEWRKKNDLPGNCTKETVYEHAHTLGFAPPPLCGKCPRCKDHCGQDAADASLLSRALWVKEGAPGAQPAGAAVVELEGAPV